jgi:hypothetical protein
MWCTEEEEEQEVVVVVDACDPSGRIITCYTYSPDDPRSMSLASSRVYSIDNPTKYTGCTSITSITRLALLPFVSSSSLGCAAADNLVILITGGLDYIRTRL